VKIITLCGSYRFKSEMTKVAEELTLKGNCVLTPIDLTRSGQDAYTAEEIFTFKAMHKEKIRLSDAIFVVNVDGYIGDSTRSEIEYARSLGKEILFLNKYFYSSHNDLGE